MGLGSIICPHVMKICIIKYIMLNYKKNSRKSAFISIYIYLNHFIVDFSKRLFVISVFALSIGLRKKLKSIFLNISVVIIIMSV